ncbi:MAG TPA: carboxypeptidase regulatory-like domain-containing protein [Terriglobia bacterium]|nr:carboxypeptidase regulatory-like domain-containing protein [Terriglobia bacterium]
MKKCIAIEKPAGEAGKPLLRSAGRPGGLKHFCILSRAIEVFLVLIAVAIFFSPFAVGQAVNGSVVGTVTDSSGAVVPQAKVTITNVGTSVSEPAMTDGSGYYSFPDLPPAIYKVTIEKQGFTSVVRSGVTLAVNSTVRVDVKLSPGQVTQTVTVQSQVAELQTDTAKTGGTLSSVQAEQLPLGTNRNFQNLLTLVPGTTGVQNNHSHFFNPQNSLNSEVNGTSSMTNNFQIEGVNDNERTGLLQVYIPPVEAIQDVNVTTSNYDAEQGTALGAVTNVILKSGTNQFHGSAYEIYNGQALNSRGFFDRGPQGASFIKPPKIYNYWGGQFGGPIRKGKTFFFVDFLRTDDHEGQFQTLSVPTAAERSGDFSDPTLDTIYNPNSGDTVDCLPGGNAKLCGTGRIAFTGNNIAGSIDPIAAKLVGLVPLPNNNLTASGSAKYTNNFLETTRYTQDNKSFDVKIDQYQGQNDHISGRLGYMSPTTVQAPAYGLAGGPIGGGFEATGTDSTYSSDITWDHIFSPTLIMQNRVGLNRYRNTANQTDYGSSASTQIGIPGVNVDPFTSGLTGIFIQSTTSDPLVGYSASLPWIRSETDFDFVSNWNKIIKNHTLKWGVNIIRIRDDLLQEQTFSPRGAWDFDPDETSTPGAKVNFANNFASFLLDVPNTVGRDLPVVFPAFRQTQFFAYVNDKWQVDPKLTLNLGVRWELYPPATPPFPGGFSNYDPNNNTLVVAGVGGNPMNIGMQSRYHDFAPRFGLAYRLSDKNVIRAGFGISYEPFEDNTYAYNFPVKQNNAFNALSAYGPALYPNGTPVTFGQGFPAPLIASVPSNGIIQANTPLLLNQSYQVINLHYLDPYIQSWNLAYERSLPGQFQLDIAYVGNAGVHMPVQYNLNAVTNPADIGLGSAGQPEFVAFGRTASTTLFFAGESSNYNALQVKFDRRFSHGFALTTAYTYGKSLGYVEENSENSSSANYYINFKRNYARTDFDNTHTFVQSYVWDLPMGTGHRFVGSGPGARILGGWQLSGVLTLRSGGPLNFGCTCQSLNAPGNGQSPQINGSFQRLYGVDTKPWFNTSVFSDPSVDFKTPTFGDLGPYVFSGPGYFNLDAALFRSIKLSERFNLQFRTDWFSTLNIPQFGNPGLTYGSSTFGYVTGTNGGNRNIDFGLKLNF